MAAASLFLPRTENQARGLAEYALDFLAGRFAPPGERALRMVEKLRLDSVACGVSAIACGASAPRLLREEAWQYPSDRGVPCFGSRRLVMPEKAVLANCAAVREWDANGTNFGYGSSPDARAGEFGHNDFYPVAIAAGQLRGLDGEAVLRAMLLIDEIRGRLAEVFSLKSHKVDHVVHGAIASAIVYGAVIGATADQIDSALGLLVAHYIPFRALRAGKQLSDSKGASAAISAEMAVVSVGRAMRGFVGPTDIFRNPEAIFCLFEPPAKPDASPFDLRLATSGDDFAVLGMHFKLGLYEHQSAGAIQGLMDLLERHPALARDENAVRRVRISIYQPAFGIIADPAKRDPRTRQSADHSMFYIVATLLRKAIETGGTGWRDLMLMPADYDGRALVHPLTRRLMDRIEVRHGGPEFDARYPDGIPTTVEIEHAELGRLDSGMVMYPAGHARNTTADLDGLLDHKFRLLAGLGVDDVEGLRRRFSDLGHKTSKEIAELYDFELAARPRAPGGA
jgi:2-methylcitrate dehydratase